MVEKEEWEKIIDNSATGFEHTTDKGLINTRNFNSILSDKGVIEHPKEWEKAQMEMTRRLKNEIKKFEESSSKQSEVMIKLTKWIKGLTIALGIIGLIQIGLILKQLGWI